MEAARAIYAVGADHVVYKQPLEGLSPSSEWTVAANGTFLSLAIAGSAMYGVGTDGRIYRQSLDSMSATSGWELASADQSGWIAVAEDGDHSVIFKVGADHRLYSQSLANLTASGRWAGPLCEQTRVISIAVAGDTMYGIGVDHKVYAQGLGQVAMASAWEGPISQDTNIVAIAIDGKTVYGVGVDGQIYRQVSSSTWSLVAQGNVTSIAIRSRASPRWLLSSPNWTAGGSDAIGVWVSSVADDEWGNPDTEGPASLLSGGHWRSNHWSVRDQWFVVDFGKELMVSAVRVRGQPDAPLKSPQAMRFQAGASLDGPWTDSVQFEGRQDGDWVEASLTPPVKGRWWRLFVEGIWGDNSENQDFLVVTGFGVQAALAPPAASGGGAQWDEEEEEEGERAEGGCPSRFLPPPRPSMATDHNGVALADVCMQGPGPHHVFVVGDWGGVVYEEGAPPRPADHRSPLFPTHERPFVVGVDDKAQMRVAEQMQKRAAAARPGYILNVGDSFYWGGIEATCGARLGAELIRTGQWRAIFEDVYAGLGLDGVQWLGVLGNHDYGGFMFTSGWDQVIGYTWGGLPESTNRWVLPAQYWMSTVRYPGFAVDYFFLDTNAYDAFQPHDFVGHNLCSVEHNPAGATCAPQGPRSVWDCPGWFWDLWVRQRDWLDGVLTASRATWQVIVTHFPPEWGKEFWIPLTRKYGIDLLIVGHRHRQEVHPVGPDNILGDTAYIVSGGGGGITSQETPSIDGADDQYGFMDLTFTNETILVEAVSHGGLLRSRTLVRPRHPDPPLASSEAAAGPPSPGQLDPVPPEPLAPTATLEPGGSGQGTPSTERWTPIATPRAASSLQAPTGMAGDDAPLHTISAFPKISSGGTTDGPAVATLEA